MDNPDAPASGLSFEDLLAGKGMSGGDGAPVTAEVVPPPLGDPESDPSAHRLMGNIRRELTHQLRSSSATVLDGCFRVRGGGNVGEVIYQPDLIVDDGEPDRNARVARSPRVVFEVAAAGSARAEYVKSWCIHEKLASAEAHVLVDPAQVCVIVQRRRKDGTWEEEVLTDATDSIFLPTIHCILSLETVYENVIAAADEDRV